MLKLLVTSALMIISVSAFAQEKAIPDDFLNEMAADLAKIQEITQQASNRAALAEDNLAAIRVTSPNTFARQEANANSATAWKFNAGDTLLVTDARPGWYGVEVPGVGTKWVSAGDAVVTAPTMEMKTQFLRSISNQAGASAGDGVNTIVSQLLMAASRMRNKYDDNPYLKITGFDVSLTLIPSLSVSFEFK